MRRRLVLIALIACCGVTSLARGGSADQDWEAIVALDAGPSIAPKTREAAAQNVAMHLARQEKALRGFLADHAGDNRSFEARLRLARLLQIRADMENAEPPRAEAQRLLDELEKIATPEQRPELDFAKVARLMRGLRAPNAAQREVVLKAARKFQNTHPGDRRIAPLLAEVATLFDSDPKTKEVLLEDAQSTATDAELKDRINDDLKRVRLLGREIPLRFTAVQGEEVEPSRLRGKPVFVIFFATPSPPAVAAIARLQQELAALPAGSVRVVGISLDDRRETLTDFLQERGVKWPVAFDGRGWQSPLVREFGINAVPTVWLLDGQGRLRALNGLEAAAAKARQLLQER